MNLFPLRWLCAIIFQSGPLTVEGRTRIILPTLGLLALLAPPALALDESKVLDEYSLTSWTTEDGLLTPWVTAIAQDEEGYLWLGTENGLVRFDGVRFVPFDASDETALPRMYIDSVYVTQDASLWVGFGGGGISRVRGGRVKNYGQGDGFTGRRVTQFVEDHDGTLWAASRAGLYRFAHERWELVGSAQGLPEGPVYKIYQDRSDTLWLGTSAGVFRREKARRDFHVVDESIRHFPSFSEFPSGALWITDPQIGFRRLAGQKSPLPSPRPPHQGIGHALLHDRLGNLWLATQGQGLWFLQRDKAQDIAPDVFGTDDGLSSNTVHSLFEDREGNVWVGTRSGLHKFSRRRLKPMANLGPVQAIAAGLEGDMWVAEAQRLARFSGAEPRWYGDGLQSVIRALHVDMTGVLWIATESGVARLSRDRIAPVPLVKGEWPAQIRAITTDASGALWICDEGYGLFHWSKGRLTTFDPSPEIDHSMIDFVATDSQGRVWLSVHGGGLGVLDQEHQFRLVRAFDDRHFSDLTMHEDSTGAMWFGGGDRLTRFKDGTLVAVDQQNGFPNGLIGGVLDDDQGYLWIMTSSSGLIRLAQSEFDKTVVDPTHQLDFRFYDAGFTGSGRSGFPRFALGPNRRFWFVTTNGLIVVDPRQLSADRPAPVVRIEGIDGDGREFTPAPGLVLPAGTKTLRIDYTALTFFSPRRVLFRYRLEGFDEQWVDAGTRRQAFYTQLTPQEYRFRVIARNGEGLWTEQDTVLDFSVQPLFFQTGWFAFMCVGTLIMILLAAWRFRVRQVRHQFVLVFSERVRLSREIHDTLLQSLVGVALQLDGVSSDLGFLSSELKQRLRQVRTQVEEYIREARQSIWDLRSPTLETRSLSTALQEVAKRVIQNEPLAFEFVVSGDARRCPRIIEEQILRIGHEALINTIRHARARQIRMELHYEADSLKLRIEDEGCGFSPNSRTHEGGDHCGLSIMQERAERVGGIFMLSTQPGIGTQIEVVIPTPSTEQADNYAQAPDSSSVRR